MAVFISLKPLGGTLPHLVNVDAIQHVRPLAKGVCIYWGTPIPGDEGSYIDSDDYDVTMDVFIGKLRLAQVEVLP